MATRKVKRYGGLTIWEILFVIVIEFLAVYLFIYKGYCNQ